MENELKPCPFCGSLKTKAMFKRKNNGTIGFDETVYVRCTKCHARGGIASGRTVSGTPYDTTRLPKWAVTREELIEKAYEKWNRRATPNER